MISNITITVLPGEEDNTSFIKAKAAQALSIKPSDITSLVFKKKSIDARRGQVKIHLMYTVYVGEEPPVSDGKGSFTPKWIKTDKNSSSVKDVIIVGSGPAGLFAALRLLEHGLRPVIIERGQSTSIRKTDIAQITISGTVDSESNYCFGEGGAGTFSDGKLYTRSNKRGDISRILSLFAYHGADEAILTDAHPHIGTDRLPGIINRMRQSIEENGGEIRFGGSCSGLEISDGTVTGVRVRTKEGESVLSAAAVILASGHSARDIYEMLAQIEAEGKTNGKPLLEEKGFAIGVRVEHPRSIIDRIQYHGTKDTSSLNAAEYRLTAQADGRGVYSFCMCPGGFIVPSATADDEIVVNGMSASGRNTKWSNAAIVVETRPEDIPDQFRNGEKYPALAGVRYQKWLEQEAKKNGKGQSAPAQLLIDFIDRKSSRTLPECSYTPGIVPSRLDSWIPPSISDRLREGFLSFDRFMHGFICREAVLVAIETRSSSPVRILRDKATMESTALSGLFPAGEGSGYSGGIVSSAMDGENAADKVAKKLRGK
jgi:uncharacterized FAD-dependent dehydrogenase